LDRRRHQDHAVRLVEVAHPLTFDANIATQGARTDRGSPVGGSVTDIGRCPRDYRHFRLDNG
jgi:hypothetical protein